MAEDMIFVKEIKTKLKIFLDTPSIPKQATTYFDFTTKKYTNMLNAFKLNHKNNRMGSNKVILVFSLLT